MADLNAWQSIVLGVVQGITEFLPISSSAHLRIIPEFFGWGDPGAAFTAVTQLGTIAAVLLYFRKDLWSISTTWTRSLWRPELRSEQDAKLGWYIGLGTIPIGIFGLLFQDEIETTARNLYLIAAALILLGLVLLLAERVSTRTRTVNDITLRDGLLMGLAQSLALIPGVSRAGSTITAGLFLGLERAAAARFSFLLSIPAVLLSGLFTLPDAVSGDGPGVVPTVIATVLAFISGYASIAFLLRYLATNSTMIFVVYRVGLGALVLALLAAGVINAT